MPSEEEAIELLKDKRMEINYKVNGTTQFSEALDMAIKAVEMIGYLIDRPCEACEFHKEDGCSRWNCVFEEVLG